MSMFTLAISCLTTSNLPWSMDLTFQFPTQYCSLQHWTLLPSRHIHNWAWFFALALSLHSLWSYFSTFLQEHIRYLPTWGVHLSVSYLFDFSYSSWGSQGKNTEVVCHSFLHWTTFCQKSPDGQYWHQTDYILCSQRWRSSIQSGKTRPGADFHSDHELLIANLKKVGKTTRPFRYDLN